MNKYIMTQSTVQATKQNDRFSVDVEDHSNVRTAAALRVKLSTLLMAIFAAATIFSGTALAQSAGGLSGLLGGKSAEPDLLMPEVAFAIEKGVLEGNRLEVNWTIAEGYYMYRDKFGFALKGAETASVPDAVDVLDLTRGKIKADAYFGDVEVNRQFTSAQLGLPAVQQSTNATLQVTYQGCADIGVCFPPQTHDIELNLMPVALSSGSDSGSNSGGVTVPGKAANAAAATAASGNGLQLSRQDQLAATLGKSSIPVVLSLFFGLGLLLAFTPCVFPMIPILSSLIVGQGESITVKRSTALSVIYVLAMALTYTIVGVIVGLSGENIQAWLQNPWVLSSFALLLVVLALSMFGFYELQMPVAVQEKLNSLSNKQEGGTWAGAAVMGFLSALIVGPCVTAPLVGALIFIADTGDAVLGGLALFALSIGMGAPLVLVGASCGKLMPRAGAWMNTIKAVFGVMMLGLAIWMLSRFVSPAITMLLSAALVIISGVYLGALDSLRPESNGWHKLFKGAGVLGVIYGVALFAGAMSGGNSLLHPLKHFGGAGMTQVALQGNTNASPQHQGELEFLAVKGVEQLDELLKTANAQGKPLILDFYADWCVSCKEMEAFTFTDSRVQEQMSRAVLLRADVTDNDKLDKSLLKKFGLFGPPAILVFSPVGDEIRNARVVGFMSSDDFNNHLKAVYQTFDKVAQSSESGMSDNPVTVVSR